MSSDRQHLVIVFNPKSNPEQRQAALEAMCDQWHLRNLHRTATPRGSDARAHWYTAYITDGNISMAMTAIRTMHCVTQVESGDPQSIKTAKRPPSVAATLDQRPVFA